MSKIKPILIKDLNSLFKEKSFLSIVILQIILFSTARSFNAGLMLISNPDQAANIFDIGSLVKFGVLHNDSFTRLLEKRTKVVFFENMKQGFDALKNNTINIFIISPPDLNELLYSQNKIVIDAYYNGGGKKVDLSLLLLKSALSEFKDDVRNKRIGKNDVLLDIMNAKVPQGVGELEMLFTFTLPLLLLFSVITSGSFVIDLLTEEIERKTIHKILQTKAKIYDILIAKSLLPPLITISFAFFWIFIFALQSIFIQNIFVLIPFLFFISLFYSSIGLLISCSFKKNKPSQTAYTFVMLFSLLLITSSTSSFLPSFIVSELALDPFPNIIPVVFWVFLSLSFYFICILVSPRILGELT